MVTIYRQGTANMYRQALLLTLTFLVVSAAIGGVPASGKTSSTKPSVKLQLQGPRTVAAGTPTTYTAVVTSRTNLKHALIRVLGTGPAVSWKVGFLHASKRRSHILLISSKALRAISRLP